MIQGFVFALFLYKWLKILGWWMERNWRIYEIARLCFQTDLMFILWVCKSLVNVHDFALFLCIRVKLLLNWKFCWYVEFVIFIASHFLKYNASGCYLRTLKKYHILSFLYDVVLSILDTSWQAKEICYSVKLQISSAILNLGSAKCN